MNQLITGLKTFGFVTGQSLRMWFTHTTWEGYTAVRGWEKNPQFKVSLGHSIQFYWILAIEVEAVSLKSTGKYPARFHFPHLLQESSPSMITQRKIMA